MERKRLYNVNNTQFASLMLRLFEPVKVNRLALELLAQVSSICVQVRGGGRICRGLVACWNLDERGWREKCSFGGKLTEASFWRGPSLLLSYSVSQSVSLVCD